MNYLVVDHYGTFYGIYDTESQADDKIGALYKKDLDSDQFEQGKYQILVVMIKEIKDTTY